MNTQENNKLIAEFLGVYQDDKGYWGFTNTKEHQRWHTDRFLDATHYDTDWNWLMEVVENILIICAENDDLEKYAVITDNIPYIIPTYNEVVAFIKGYNENK